MSWTQIEQENYDIWFTVVDDKWRAAFAPQEIEDDAEVLQKLFEELPIL